MSHRSEFQHVMTEIRNNPVKFLEENLILNPQCYAHHDEGNDSNLLIVFYVQIMPDDFVMQLHRF
ncbi:putative phosphatidate cytidylyltransferase [Escherichia coli]|nr:putative phosphatidate cytidylyltransferase [Escherichia coli]